MICKQRGLKRLAAAVAKPQLVWVLTLALAACGGDGPSSGTSATTPVPAPVAASASVAFPTSKPTDREASRFLAQSTMGATEADIARLKDVGYDAWFEEQTAKNGSLTVLNELATASNALLPNDQHGAKFRGNYVLLNEALWKTIVKNDDLLRERVAYALSQIYVISAGSETYEYPRASANYYDTLRGRAFGNFRDLIKDVALHPAMGLMLSHMYNQKGDAATGRIPDQNFARELMQLFTIGLWKLNPDGSRILDAAGQPIPAYTQDDIVGISKVMTGFAWASQSNDWNRQPSSPYPWLDSNAMEKPMKAFPAYHDAGEKKFLGVTIPAGSTSDPVADVDKVIDTLFQNPNTPPFISKQLIQFLVTSNPSPAYVQRVSTVFRDNGQGVRGDLKAVVKAILADEEARSSSFITQPSYGRVREPVLRMAQIQRLLNARDTDNIGYSSPIWEDSLRGIGQQPLRARTVFNDYRPDYSPPGSELARQNLVAPAMQLINETSTYGWQDMIGKFLDAGGFADCCSDVQRRTLYLALDFSALTPLARTPDALVDKLNLMLMGGQMSPALRAAVIVEIGKQGDRSARTGITMPKDQLQVSRAIWAIMISPEYLVQK